MGEGLRQNKGKEIEHILKNYRTYQVAIKNIERELKSDHNGRDGGSICYEDKVRYMCHEKERYINIIESIESSLDIMGESEKEFIKERYFENYSIRKIAMNMNYSEKYIFSIRKRVLEKLEISLVGVL